MNNLSPAAILYDVNGNPVGVVLDGSIYRLQSSAKVANVSGTHVNPATEDTLALIKAKTDSIPTDPAKESGKLTSLESILTAIRDTSGIKKIVDPLPAGTNLVGKVQVTDGTNTPVVKNTAPTSTDYGIAVRLVSNATGVGADVNVNGWFGSTLPTVGQKLMASSIPVVIASDHSTISVKTSPSGSAPGIAFGTITTGATTTVPVLSTTYTEQTSDAQRSIASASANDTAAGTGARQVRLTYFTSTGAGPYTETLTLNGTTGVNTVASDICFIEKLVVTSAGSGGVNAGIITFYSAINKGGVAIGTIAAGVNRTLWAHHYVPIDKYCYITGISGNNNNASNGTILVIRYRTIGVANAAEEQVSDFVRMGGGTPNTLRTYGTPITVAGPARLVLYATPEGTPTIIQRGAFDFSDL